ncbi:MAG: glucosyltransferase domain-containing protein [Oscillospiraceae bacterium]
MDKNPTATPRPRQPFLPHGVALSDPEQAFKAMLTHIPKYQWLTFCATFLLGLLTHLFMLVNKLPNHDDIGHIFDATYGTMSGRWLLPAMVNLDGKFSAPWLIGVLSMLAIALAACFVVSIFRIRRPLGCILTGALMVSFPTVSSTLTYMFTADAYFLCLALACLAAWLTVKYRYGFLGGIVALTLSMGIYQSYFGVAAVLLVGALIFETLDNRSSFKTLLLRGVKFVITLAAGLLFYMLIVKFTTRNTELVSYMGISSMGSLSLSELPQLIFSAYGRYFTFFLRRDNVFHFAFLRYAFVLVGIATAALGVYIIRAKKLPILSILLLAVLAILYPLAGNIVYVMAPDAPAHLLMVYGLCFILLAPLALAEYYIAMPHDAQKSAVSKSLCSGCCWVIVAVLALTAYSYNIYSNNAYLKMHLGYEQAYSHSTRLLSAIEGTEGYDRSIPVVFIGAEDYTVLKNPTPELDRTGDIGVFAMGNHLTSYTYDLFLKRFLGFTNPLYLDGTPQSDSCGQQESVKAMPVYPAAGSIATVDGIMVVKLNGN